MESRGENCTLCCKLLNSDSLTITEDVLALFEFLVETIDRAAFQNGLICSACLEKIKEAVNFKTLYLAKQENSNVETKQETVCDKKSIICYICKTATEQNSCMSLFNPCYENVVTYMIQKEDLVCFVSPQICDTCHLSALNFQSMTQFLSVYNKRNNDLLKRETVTDENEFKIDVVYNCFPTDSILNLDRTNQLKQEIKKIKESEEDFQKKQELGLKETCEAGPSGAGFWSLSYEDQERSAIVPRLEHLNVTNDSYLTINIAKIEMDCKEYSNDNINDKFDELEMFKCSECRFQAEHTNELYKHAITHINLGGVDILQDQNYDDQTKHTDDLKRKSLIHNDDCKRYLLIYKYIHEVERLKCHNCVFQTKHKRSLKQHMLTHRIFKCRNCDFQTKRKQSLKIHMLTHKNINEIKMFKCRNCDFQTKCKHNLKIHMLTHKNINEIKMFKCDECEFQTKYKHSLTKHTLTHNNIKKTFQCPNCEFQTKYKKSLTKHTLTHNIQKTFQCPNCEFRAIRKIPLMMHMFTHKNIISNPDMVKKTFKCPNCEFQAEYKISLIMHMFTHKDINTHPDKVIKT